MAEPDMFEFNDNPVRLQKGIESTLKSWGKDVGGKLVGAFKSTFAGDKKEEEKGMGGVSKDLAKHMRDVRHSKYTNAKWRGSGQSPAQVFGWRWTDHRLDMAMRRLNNSAYNSQLNRMVKSATNPVRYVDTTISAKKVSTPSFSTKLTADNE